MLLPHMTPRLSLTPKRRFTGFTLVELMITLAVAAILLAIAAPSFKNLIASQRIRTASFDLVAHLMLARSEAIKQNGNVTIASVSGTNAWTNGWTISSPSGTVKQQSAYGNLTITTGDGGSTSIVYNRSGRLVSDAAITFQVSDASSGSTVQPRCISVGVTGQPISKLGGC